MELISRFDLTVSGSSISLKRAKKQKKTSLIAEAMPKILLILMKRSPLLYDIGKQASGLQCYINCGSRGRSRSL